MFNGRSIRDEAAEVAFPRASGTDGDGRAIAWLGERLEATGFEVSQQWFSYDLRPAHLALQALLTVAAMLIAGAGFVTPFSPASALIMLGAAIVPGLVFLGWSPWLERLYQSDGMKNTANIVGRRRVQDPRLTVMVMAHHDSKSQSLTFPFRMGLTVLSILGCLVLVVVATLSMFSGPDLSATELSPIVSLATGACVALLSTMKSGNRSPGGVDNAGSVAILLALARTLPKEISADVELIFLSTGAEEDHMVGALRWLDENGEDTMELPVFCLNLDGAGAPGRPVLIERYGLGRLFSAEMSGAARRAASRLKLRPRGILMLPGIGIDSIPFAHRGIPCLTLSSGSLGRATMSIHSANDRAEHLDAQTLEDVANLALETIKELAGSKTSPQRHREHRAITKLPAHGETFVVIRAVPGWRSRDRRARNEREPTRGRRGQR